MERENQDFQHKSLRMACALCRRLITGAPDESAADLRAFLDANAVFIGAQRHEFYKQIENVLEGCKNECRRVGQVQLEILDEWYEIQEIAPDVCCIYGAIWAREKDAGAKADVLDMDTRFTVTCHNTPQGIKLLNMHQSVAAPDHVGRAQQPGQQTNAELARRAEIDYLTGLYNRMALVTRITAELTHIRRGTAALFIIDIDDFKHVNDTYGHLCGDMVLQQVAVRMSSVFRRGDIKGRLGGDEFMVLVCGIQDESSVLRRAEQLCRAVEQISVGDVAPGTVSCTAGIALFPVHGEAFNILYEKADVALYEAKSRGKNQYAIYDPTMEKARTAQPESKPVQKKARRNKTRHKRSLLHAGLAMLCVLLLIAGFSTMCVQYLSYMQRMTRTDSLNQLEVLSAQIADRIQGDILHSFSAVEEISQHYPYMHFENEAVLLAACRKETGHWGFHDMSFIDDTGQWLHADGRVTASEDAAFMEALADGKNAVSDIVSIHGKDSILFATPMFPVRVEENTYVAVAVAFALNAWDQLVRTDAFNGWATLHIVTGDGDFVVRGDTRAGDKNFFDSISDISFIQDGSLQSVRSDLTQGNTGYMVYINARGERTFLSYTPVGFQDWRLVCIVPAFAVEYAADALLATTVAVCIVVAGVFALLLLLSILLQLRSRKQLQFAAYVDTVTGGANKSRFEQYAGELLKSETQYVLAYGDICQFKIYNERLGREEADSILRRVYLAMEDKLEKDECCARLMADQYALLLRMDTPTPPHVRLERLALNCAMLENAAGEPYGIQMRFGLCLAPGTGQDIASLTDKANLALKLHTPSRDNVCIWYDPDMLVEIQEEKRLMDAIPGAVKREEFVVEFQPAVRLEDGAIDGAEALVRWEAPGGRILPENFIAAAEKNGCICEIDRFVFREVCRTLSRWRRQGRKTIPISFNLSRAQLDDPDFLDAYRALMEKYQVPGSDLRFEFTELLMCENVQAVAQVVREIHDMGCKCSIDNFGNGYSSLSVLSRFNADTVKLGRSFFDASALSSERSDAVVESIIRLSQRLGMDTVAEGVETFAQAEKLQRMGCSHVQGYVYYQPMPVEELESLLFNAAHNEIMEIL